MFRTSPTRTATAAAMLSVAMLSVAPAAAEETAASTRAEHPLDAGRVDVAAISLDGESVRLGAGDGTGRQRDPSALLYTAQLSEDGVEVGWDTSDIGAGEVFGDTVRLRLTSTDGPADVQAPPLTLPVGDQGTTTWTFPEPGPYTLTLAVEANLLTGEPVGTQERYRIDVAQAAAPPSSEAPPPQSQPQSQSQSPPPAAPRAARAQPPATTPGRVVLDDGHVDAVAPRLVDGALQIQVKDGSTVGQSGGRVHWREPSDVTFHAKPETAAELPDDPALAFLGNPGDEVFLLPQQQSTGILWAGWSTEELRADQVAGPVRWRLTEVDGPGAFGVFTTGSFGESTVIFDSTDGLPDTHRIALGTHAHANWAFAEQGVYRLTVDVTAELTGGRTVTDTEVYTFTVGDAEADGTAPPGGGSGGPDGPDEPGGSGTPDRDLAHTGVGGVLPLTLGGAALLVLGGVALRVTRKASR